MELNEVYLRLNGFHDPWLEQKQMENKASLSKLKQRLLDLDSLYADEKWIELFRGFLAGMNFINVNNLISYCFTVFMCILSG